MLIGIHNPVGASIRRVGGRCLFRAGSLLLFSRELAPDTLVADYRRVLLSQQS